ncbi:hypothetical protein PENSUB_103 [Penicillium subrubescens]|uniref:Uncharacterized protein n=1 Tax=Penicillium subrubescens TaxID=1316194 RepID=A0A1Q5UNZ4_9EURO|nr:hypothetical protein PENSUB_103 [Penicillium subrubescens]
MHTLKYVLLAISGASLVFASAPPTLTKRASWVAAFYKLLQIRLPGKVVGSGERACSPVDGADCLNGSPDFRSGYMVCAYHGANCDGWRTGLGDSGLSGHAVIYENGYVQSIII